MRDLVRDGLGVDNRETEQRYRGREREYERRKNGGGKRTGDRKVSERRRNKNVGIRSSARESNEV